MAIRIITTWFKCDSFDNSYNHDVHNNDDNDDDYRIYDSVGAIMSIMKRKIMMMTITMIQVLSVATRSKMKALIVILRENRINILWLNNKAHFDGNGYDDNNNLRKFTLIMIITIRHTFLTICITVKTSYFEKNKQWWWSLGL